MDDHSSRTDPLWGVKSAPGRDGQPTGGVALEP